MKYSISDRIFIAMPRGEEGFTLVELMVVVAIVGVLSVIAIPQYTKFTGRARQSEAKSTLGSILTAERAFAVEKSSFSGCLAAVGVAPVGNTYYATGLKDLANVPLNVGSVTCAGGTAADKIHYWAATDKIGTATTSVVNGATSMLASTFNVGATGSIQSGATPDEWTMTDTGLLTNTVSGL